MMQVCDGSIVRKQRPDLPTYQPTTKNEQTSLVETCSFPYSDQKLQPEKAMVSRIKKRKALKAQRRDDDDDRQHESGGLSGPADEQPLTQ